MKIVHYLLFISFLILAGCANTQPSHPTTPYPLQKKPQPTPSLNTTDNRFITRRSVDLTVDPNDVWSRIRMGFAIPDIDNQLVRDWEIFYSKRPEYLKRTSERAGRYMFYIVEEINRRGLPTELALLPYVESSFNPGAYSTAKAAGLWQFIPSTGKQYKLHQDAWRDLRRDPIASTNAALDYLSYLYNFQGDWHLALASYNWGEGSVQRAVRKNAAANLATDYLSLSMPNETRNYVPKLQAIKNIISDPERFGITLPKVNNEPYFEAIKNSTKRDLDVNLAAQLAEISVEEFKLLNPSYNKGVILAEQQPRLLLPTNKLDVFKTNLANYEKSLMKSWVGYSVKEGDSLESVAKEHGINVETLALANGLSTSAQIYRGDALTVPPQKPRPSTDLSTSDELTNGNPSLGLVSERKTSSPKLNNDPELRNSRSASTEKKSSRNIDDRKSKRNAKDKDEDKKSKRKAKDKDDDKKSKRNAKDKDDDKKSKRKAKDKDDDKKSKRKAKDKDDDKKSKRNAKDKDDKKSKSNSKDKKKEKSKK